ncbi:MAG: hypothetical protein COU63_01170 [Candidatus Pacebacteria bacterium CG10_big_fil_rev_8_21_14_0_10_36_11]|nr:hypothetical protein [Candidatus Pacearchaeota archaeon]OIP73800.1 MAG: hypothetical protein AUK08_04550 [Candidatus Pacebacteria bacterium CG2_30_36_39]PIR64614.1 MAG: hypothetical protein COU63_01170 [Candidatus Pacebacteria bacterium CG10_big_fil_rev_8_21_14_0_10_36_11]PJC42954.1 MAG: hypothetical protein CO040_01720 [Candidatus Pacebacteria bacterium CG_4_9_14_0_2_um_filter_36_8]
MVISFVSANSIISQSDSLPLAQRKMYLNKEILPDHVFYPIFMVFDRVRLTTASDSEKSRLQISYGWQRLDATKRLLDKGYQSLSFTTLTKALKYQNAGLLSAKQQLSVEEQKAVFNQAKQFQIEVEALVGSFTDQQQHEINGLFADQIHLTELLLN